MSKIYIVCENCGLKVDIDSLKILVDLENTYCTRCMLKQLVIKKEELIKE